MHDEVVERVVARVREIRVGLPEAQGTQMGSLISEAHRRRVLGFVDAARREGAELLTGGGPPEDEDLRDGAFVVPTVFDDVAPGSTLWREEVFGPVLAVHAWDDEADAVALANDTEYGLTASVWTKDIDRALRTADALEAGYVWVNDVETRYTGVPFGGWKQSGLGTEQGIVSDLLQFTRLKAVNVAVR